MILVYLLTGPPGDITDIIIPPDIITACSFVVQWSRPSSDPVCGPVQYTVTILIEGGMLIINDNTMLTNYTVTELNGNIVYYVAVTASNNAGSSGSVTNVRVMTNSIGKFILYAYIRMYVSNLHQMLHVYTCYDQIIANSITEA